MICPYSHFIQTLQIVWSVFEYSPFHFITLGTVFFHLLQVHHFPTLKLGKCIGTLLKILLFFNDSFLFPILYQT